MIADPQFTGISLPVPDEFALKLSDSLSAIIRTAIIENGGSISFEQYMQMALYEPAMGYYSAGSVKFGEEGDFVTAPEISSLFSRCIARQCQQVLSVLSSGDKSSSCVLELGPGTGTMAIDIMREMERNNVLPDIYYLLEPSADLRERQQRKVEENIPHLADRMIWLDRLPEEKIQGVILANEIIDAMPVKRLVIDDLIEEIVVTCETESEAESTVKQQIKFSEARKEIDASLRKISQEIIDSLPEDLSGPYITEINCHIKPWLKSLDDILDKGLILISDYGYPRHEFFHPQRKMGTLICHYRHHAHADPFLYPGLQDITASVDFTSVAEAATDVGLHVSGFTTQAHFLIACGLDQFIPEVDLDDAASRATLTQQVSKLTMPGEMGEKFKFIALSKSLDIQYQGFGFVDQRARL